MLQQSLVQVPKSAILIEISPRSLIQTLLKKVLYNPIDLLTNSIVPFVLPLTPLLNVNIDPKLFVHHFLSQLGRLYLHGVDFDSVKLFVPSIYEQSIYPVRIDQSCIDFFSDLGLNFEPSTYALPIARNPQSSLEIKIEPSRETRTTLEFFPFTEIQNQYNKSGYIMVDKDHNENDFIFNSIQPTAESKCLLSDFFDFYFSECNRYMKHLVVKINNPGQNVTIEPKSLPTGLQDQLEKITIYQHTTSGQIQINVTDLFEGGSFLKFLINTSACLPSEPVDLIKKFNQAFSQDLVLDQLSNSTLYFKNCLNLIVENLSDKDLMLKIVEISASGSQLCANKFVDILSSYGDLKHEIDYHFVPLNSSAQYLQNESVNFTIQDWNLKITNGKFECQIPDEFFGQFDLVLLNGCLSSSMALASEPEVKNWIQGSIEKLLKPSGFVMFNEFTSNFDFVQNSHKLEMLINGNKIQNTKLIQQIKQLESFRSQSSQDIQTKIEQQIKQLEKLLMQDECLNLKLQDMELWRRFLQSLTLVPIGLKTDSALRTIFIHRKSPTALNESIVSIDEFLVNQTETVSFIDKISQSLGDDKIDRLWLLNKKPIRPLSLQTALISVFEGLRSLPNGDKLRCLFLHDDQKISLDSKEIQNFAQLMERIRQADLVMNYIQSGQWGSVRIGEVLVEVRPEESEQVKCQQMFKQNETYVIVNGIDSEFGLNLIQWMVESGAKYLTVTTKKSNVAEFMDVELFKKLNDLQDIYGAEIRLSSVLDLNEENECLGLVKQTCKVSPEGKIGGIFHLGNLCDQTDVQSMFNLDRLTRSGSIMPDTGYFVLFTTGPNQVVEKLCNLRYSESSKQALCIDFNVLLNDLGQEESEVRNKRCIDCLEDLLSDSCKKEAKEVKVEETMTKKQVTLMPKVLIEQLNGVELSDATKSPIFVVHPIEGHVNMLRSWAEQFPVPVYGLQYTEECLKFQSIEQLGEFYWQQIEKFAPHVEKVHLVGHTFGDSVAFEMASQRPQQSVSLTLLDSGYTKTFLNSAIVGVESNFEVETLVKFYQQFVVSNARLNFDQFYEELTKISDFDERVKFVVGKIVEQSQFLFDLNDIQTALRSFVVKSSMALKYVPTQALILNKILVVRPFLINGVQQSFRNILNLYHYFGGEVSLKTVDSTDKTFLIGENAQIVAKLVKEYIGLENF
ncbi:fatty acid synthase isoform X1 [Brachionus plicatilis]|uniref:oleoyl-[acyl-carrier-protein] hydrolase n=1 Tax=Brachionus plicatilis TaxID=10195 RepID=A0A3M7RCC0_BRAPC|nr:fatty acid synthase isoform X1 [Brachionus plicatilis]